ncbi:conserved hypothetical protein [Chloroherpeton thalassium ATCC 35110]|uniref:Penicillin-binding protein activator LpoB n=1 Tax=Chloroherpeton thalassium (strain ATCC 35110 / GB-78) TaxID=517418 RepID=B3QZ20_CHLT3|nr:penicillin-binding protein activator LpoB [Chloroherpeton thalassium]ACF13713.1 conserved hypothetical protein [Chloroherpeton thalassium ATCC 35110]
MNFSLFSGCASSGSSISVQRLAENSTTDISGDWNDTDSRLVSKAMIEQVLAEAWLENFIHDNQRKPVLIVGRIKNRSHEHINVQTFVKDIERALINSGEVDFVASTDERQQVRDERIDQALNASEDTQKGPGQETGADFMVIGSIASIIDQDGGEKVKFYQINLELINLENNRKVWIGEKKIKKSVSQSGVTF